MKNLIFALQKVYDNVLKFSSATTHKDAVWLWQVNKKGKEDWVKQDVEKVFVVKDDCGKDAKLVVFLDKNKYGYYCCLPEVSTGVVGSLDYNYEERLKKEDWFFCIKDLQKNQPQITIAEFFKLVKDYSKIRPKNKPAFTSYKKSKKNLETENYANQNRLNVLDSVQKAALLKEVSKYFKVENPEESADKWSLIGEISNDSEEFSLLNKKKNSTINFAFYLSGILDLLQNANSTNRSKEGLISPLKEVIFKAKKETVFPNTEKADYTSEFQDATNRFFESPQTICKNILFYRQNEKTLRKFAKAQNIPIGLLLYNPNPVSLFNDFNRQAELFEKYPQLKGNEWENYAADLHFNVRTINTLPPENNLAFINILRLRMPRYTNYFWKATSLAALKQWESDLKKITREANEKAAANCRKMIAALKEVRKILANS